LAKIEQKMINQSIFINYKAKLKRFEYKALNDVDHNAHGPYGNAEYKLKEESISRFVLLDGQKIATVEER
jgi:hypothetical protein